MLRIINVVSTSNLYEWCFLNFNADQAKRVLNCMFLFIIISRVKKFKSLHRCHAFVGVKINIGVLNKMKKYGQLQKIKK